jgi:hypothetical protein
MFIVMTFATDKPLGLPFVGQRGKGKKFIKQCRQAESSSTIISTIHGT